jgi:hypothetical protein
MKKFKHTKTDDIVVERADGHYTIQNMAGAYLNKEWVEGSGDWIEVKEEPKKDYEILSVWFDKELPKVWKKQYYGRFKTDKGTAIADLDSLLTTYSVKSADIHSVKRLSDGEVFTIGDTIILINGHREHVIESFTLSSNDEIMINNYVNGLNFYKHAKKPLFTTEDGKEVFEGDDYWYVRVEPVSESKTWVSRHCLHAMHSCGKNKSLKTFSTREAADEWIILNKQCLSITDINNIGYFKYESALKAIKELVKSKLNNY